MYSMEEHSKFICKYCSKECKSKVSLVQHEIRCKKNPERKDFEKLSTYIKENRKGRTKEDCPEIATQAEALRLKYQCGYSNPLKNKQGTFTGKHHSISSKEKIGKSVSRSRLEGYKNSTISPAQGVGRGKYSYIVYKDKKYMLRSTYEFIYALYLLTKGIQFEMENVRVQAVRENEWAKTFICDFSIGNKIVEIKGIPSSKDSLIKESFESAGYEFEELFYPDIEKIKDELRSSYPIDELIEKIHKGHNNKDYFVYQFIE